mmetsp:Transcript_19128/g.28650  ORF Transcript_19128/g.28650 Transcript_19128/m.28650 type:complete len:268 (+) Transcript_19128:138-941(+)|eukprot:CAMPEP_0203675428 /NCGR_PEP_ID=MMETSP0090-20130426/20361_1 /ASSEMBLY_ACC=CAM_ASM_001088 /TAXON_ID=426623 /ORGANISM="Chaetoceros affinis, Strain CCMP159" /LENGTH=267 /DNA_ID=CAMNT_0050541623 /DNA_START=84 /DNA_END=887 /DNA_ORIENTATION=-
MTPALDEENGGLNRNDNGEEQQKEQGGGIGGMGGIGYGTVNASENVSLKSNTSTLTGDYQDHKNDATSESSGLVRQQQQQQQEEDEEDNYYTSNDYRYLTSTSEENRRKCINGLTPILLFLFLMGMISFVMYKNFDRMYPGHGTYNDSSGSFANTARDHFDHRSYTIDDHSENGDGDGNGQYSDNSSQSQFDATTSNTGANANANANSNNFKVGVAKENKENGQNLNLNDEAKSQSSCSSNQKCDQLGLTGQCCPTADGISLSCCNN